MGPGNVYADEGSDSDPRYAKHRLLHFRYRNGYNQSPAAFATRIGTWHCKTMRCLSYRARSNHAENKMKSRVYIEFDLDKTVGNKYEIDLAKIKNGHNPISLKINSKVTSILEKIKSNNSLLQDFCRVTRGVHPYRIGGYGKSAFIDGCQIKEDVDTRLYNSKQEKEGYSPFIYGKDLVRLQKPHFEEYISYGNWLAEPRDPWFFNGERIYSRKILGDKLVVTLINEHSIADQQVYISKPITEIKAGYICGILSSRLISYFIKNYYDEANDDFPQIKVGQLKSIPIPYSSKSMENVIDSLVRRIMELKSIESTTEVNSVELEIDQLVYELYGITEEEIKIIEGGN